jgi:hypothetical protein
MKNKFGSAMAGAVAIVTLAGFLSTQMVFADWIPISGSFQKISGGNTNLPCPGTYTGYVKATNSAGSFWLTPPTNATSCIVTDASGFPAPYVSVVQATRRSDFRCFCGTNSLTIGVTNNTTYEFIAYIKSVPPPPTNGQPVILEVLWQ